MRISAIICLAIALSLGTPSAAQSLEQTVIADLEKDGYTRIVRTRTFLGRIRIVGLRKGLIREVVINPSTSEILRDVVIRSDKVPDLPRLQPKGNASDAQGGSGI